MRTHIKLILILSILFTSILHAQKDEEEAITGYKKNIIDTAKSESLKEISSRTGGLIEKELEPDKYIIGPGDEFSISIVSSEPITLTSKVSPDGRLLIDDIGVVDLKGRTLAEAYDLINEKIGELYKTENIHVTLSEIRKFKVFVSGVVKNQVTVNATSADRVSEVINKAGGLDEEASMRYIHLHRNDSIIPVDLIKYRFTSEKETNPYVRGGDKIIVLPFLENATVEIMGNVSNPMEFEYREGDKLSTLFKIAQGFQISSDLDSVELTRINTGSQEVKKYYLDLNTWRNALYTDKELENDMDVKPGDRVYVRRKSNWQKSRYAKILGEVKYPGKYAIKPGVDRVYDLLMRAGGFTNKAYIDETTLIRQKELERQDPEMERLKTMDRSEMSESELRYHQVRSSERKGLMAIDFRKVLNDPSSIDNIYLEDKDSIIVPEQIDFVNIQGRVNNPGYVKFNPDYNYLDYIRLAGGFGYRADEDATFITKSKGQQYLAENFNYVLDPGDTILIPPEDDVTFMEIFTEALTIATQLVTIVGVVITIVRLR